MRLIEGVDRNKDQSYVLSILNQEQLAHTLLPLGELTKPRSPPIRSRFEPGRGRKSREPGSLFFGRNRLPSFLQAHGEGVTRPGLIVNRMGTVLGQHEGLAFYTIGQRKGLGFSSSEPLYVLDKNLIENELIVGTRSELGLHRLVARNVNWIGEKPEILSGLRLKSV